MKHRILIGFLLPLLLLCVFAPIFTTYAHSLLTAEIAQAFPGDVSGLQLMLRGNRVLPLAQMPGLAAVQFRQWLLIAGLILAAAGAILSMFKRPGVLRAAAVLGLSALLPLLLFAFYIQQLDQSILLSVMLTVKWTLWLPPILAAALFAGELFACKGMDRLPVGDRKWRIISAALCAITLCMLLFPFAQTTITPGTFATGEEDALATRSLSGWAWMAGREPLLKEQADRTGLFQNPVQGGYLESLVMLSDSASSVTTLFQIPTYNGSVHGMVIAAAVLLVLGLALQLIRRVDRWVPAGIITVAALLLLSEVLGMLAISSAAQFQGSVYQLMYMGLGGYTLCPLLMSAFAACAAVSAMLGIRNADSPYFVNPIPPGKRLWTVSLILAIAASVLMLLPIVSINLHTPGKINLSSPTVSQPMSGAALLAWQQPETLQNPANARGKALYGEEAAKNSLTLADFQAVLAHSLRSASILATVTIAASLLGVALLIWRRHKKRLIIAVLLLSTLLQAAAVVIFTTLLPKDVGFMVGLGSLYAAMGFSAFSAFFAGFLDYEELPKKFKLFLMLLPFLVAVFLFAYLPLSGWRYAFYNFKLGLPMDQQEYVGFKWFVSLWTNAAQRTETVRVLTNTFAMSGLGLASSWLPVAFAIFLTEIRANAFKKFVQIFTTLPNFISWVLVFSFALSIFSLDTGIVNKLLVGLGILRQPVAWLNSSEYIWLKMWLWNTWKSLGWGAIMYLAAISGIDQELYEAAKVDGAGRWRQILHITIPGLLPTFFVLLLLQISNIVNNGMEQYLVFQNAMNKSTIEVLDLYVYNISLGTRSTTTISMATAIGILKSLVSIVLLFAANRLSKAVRGESIV